LGIMHAADERNSATIDAKIQLIPRIAYGLMDEGFHSLNDVSLALMFRLSTHMLHLV